MFVNLSNHLRNRSRERVAEVTGGSSKITTVYEVNDYTDDTNSRSSSASSSASTTPTCFESSTKSQYPRSTPMVEIVTNGRGINSYRIQDNGGTSPNMYLNEVTAIRKAIERI